MPLKNMAKLSLQSLNFPQQDEKIKLFIQSYADCLTLNTWFEQRFLLIFFFK